MEQLLEAETLSYVLVKVHVIKLCQTTLYHSTNY